MVVENGSRDVGQPAAPDFRRARRPEQRDQRRRAILAVAEELLAERAIAEITLREIACRVGLASSNVLRYFESREAIFLELFDAAYGDWLAALRSAVAELPGGRDGAAAASRVAELWAGSLAARPSLCEMWSCLAAVLERNVSAELVMRFKLRIVERHTALAELTAAAVPGLAKTEALEVASLASTFVAGLWPLANPGPAVVEASAHLPAAAVHVDFAGRMERLLVLLMAGERAIGRCPGRS